MEEIIWVMVLLSAGIVVGVLTLRFLARAQAAHAFYDVMRIESGCLITFYHGLCGTAEERYTLDEIRVVRFFCRSTKGNLTFMGEMQIVKKDGQKSRRYVYDGSTYVKKRIWRTSRAMLLRTTEQIAEELALHGIRSEVDPLMYRE